jgi:hypothetical protein
MEAYEIFNVAALLLACMVPIFFAMLDFQVAYGCLFAAGICIVLSWFVRHARKH